MGFSSSLFSRAARSGGALPDIAAVAILASVGSNCAGLVDESNRPCPCLSGYVCCVNVCISEGGGGGCEDSASLAASDAAATEAGLDSATEDGFASDATQPALDASEASDAQDSRSVVDSHESNDVRNGELAPDATASDAASPEASIPDAASTEGRIPDAASTDASIADAASTDASIADAAMACAALPPPRVHFAFGDCTHDAGVVRDTAGGATGVFEGSGVRCDQSPVGGALRFSGVGDAGRGSYVRVAESLDAGAPGCGDGGVCPAGWPFTSAITVSALLAPANTQSYENILGQWYYQDSYIFNTFYDSALGQQIFRFSVQPAGSTQPVSVTAPVLAPGAPPSRAWSHWVGVYDPASLSLYQDGRLVAMQTLDAGAALQCTSVPLELGVIGRQGPCGDLDNSYFTGAIGDVQIFDVALSADQIRALECGLGWAPSADAAAAGP